jgi:hypothetical protein
VFCNDHILICQLLPIHSTSEFLSNELKKWATPWWALDISLWAWGLSEYSKLCTTNLSRKHMQNTQVLGKHRSLDVCPKHYFISRFICDAFSLV